jgi:hypothetical protein
MNGARYGKTLHSVYEMPAKPQANVRRKQRLQATCLADVPRPTKSLVRLRRAVRNLAGLFPNLSSYLAMYPTSSDAPLNSPRCSVGSRPKISSRATAVIATIGGTPGVTGVRLNTR